MTGPTEIAHAKLNIALHVRAREPDGYHRLETLFAFCEDGDRLTLIEDGPEQGGLQVIGPFADALGAGPNLVTSAAAAWARSFGGVPAGFLLDKRLPVASGIGGGSADAAAALRLLAARDRIDPGDARVTAIAMSLGADVSACVASRPARGEGRGERLVPVDPGAWAGAPVLLVNPGLPLSTARVFAGWDGDDRGALEPGFEGAIVGRNDLERAALAIVPRIGTVLAALRVAEGTTLVRMSGSGATCFALFQDVAARDVAAAALPSGWWRLATRLREAW